MKSINYIYTLIFIGFFILSCGSNKITEQNLQQKASDMTQENIDKMPAPGPAPKIKFQKPEVFKLDNGLTVILVENHKLPRVNASLRIDNQPVNLKDKKGTDALMESLLGSGSEKVSKDDFNEKIDFYGANVYFNKDGFYINALSKYFPEILALTADQALHPNFTEEEFKKEQEKLIENLKTSEKSTPAAASRVMSKLAFGNHPYGEITQIENVKNIQLEDVKRYYKNNFNPNHAYLIVVGDIDKNQAQELTQIHFGNWPKAPVTKGLSLPRIENVPATEVDFVHMPNAEQSEIKVAQRSDIRRNNPDYQKVLLMNSILGGDFNSYLNMTLREKHGWTYGARSSFGTDKYGDLFTAKTSVRNSVADSAVVVTMEQIDKIINEKVNDTVLYNTKQKYMGKFVLDMENPSTIANQAYNIFVNNLPGDYYETFLEKIEAVTVDDIQEVAKKYLHPENMRIIVAGNAYKTVPGLEKAGYAVKFYDKYGHPAKAPEMNQKIPDNITVQSIIDKYAEALGGKEKINQTKSLETVYSTHMQGVELLNTSKAMAPNLFANIVTAMGMVFSKQIFDGKELHKEARGQIIPPTPEEVEKYKNMTQPFPVLGLVKNGKLDRTESFDGNDYYVIVDTTDQTEYYFNQKTGLKEKEVSRKTIQGHEITQPVIFKDFKEVNGIKIPAVIIVKTGVQDMEFKLQDAKTNHLTPEDFK